MGSKYKKLDLSVVLKYYKRSKIQAAIIESASDKEVALSYGGTGYGRRPDMLQYPNDVLQAVKQNATSFHCSEELWKNPLQVTTGMKREELNALRIGWDLILDIDCKELEYSKIAADLLIQAIKHHGVSSVWVKFSGNHGFHIGVPFEAFPKTINETSVASMFPEGPRQIAAYLSSMIKDVLTQRLLNCDSVANLALKSGRTVGEITKGSNLLPYEILDIDTILISSRHLYRMPYSLNEKSGLVSLPISHEEVLLFTKAMAVPALVIPGAKFMDRSTVVPGEGKKLLVQAFDFEAKKRLHEKTQVRPKKVFEPVKDAIEEEYFPPCIKLIANGLADGKKRGMFILINFLKTVGWSYDMIEAYLDGWNERNPEPLREVLIKGRLRYERQANKTTLPPNCANKAYMIDMLVCEPDGFCQRIKNPAQYAIAKKKMVESMKKKPKKTAEDKNGEVDTQHSKIRSGLSAEHQNKDNSINQSQH